jgi:phage repressor protein C with HTH and peptisase S24 domain
MLETALMETRKERRLRKLKWLVDNTPGGVKEVAAKADLNYQTLTQIIKGVRLPSGNPRSVGDPVAGAIESAFGLGRGWFDSEDVPSEQLHSTPGASMRYAGEQGARTIPAFQPRPDDIEVPLTNAVASMGRGLFAPEHDEVVSSMSVNRAWLSRNATFTSHTNLALVTGFGDSMKGTFEDGDILLVDRGVTEVKVDGVYVLSLNDELYIKRLQRRPGGSLLMISDNDRYEPYEINGKHQAEFAVLGRVVLAWNAKRL